MPRPSLPGPSMMTWPPGRPSSRKRAANQPAPCIGHEIRRGVRGCRPACRRRSASPGPGGGRCTVGTRRSRYRRRLHPASPYGPAFVRPRRGRGLGALTGTGWGAGRGSGSVGRMRTARVIPCLDVDRRPGGQGRELRRPARRRRPGRAGRPLRRRGRRRARVPRHHRVERPTATRSSTWSRRTAEQVFIPFTIGGGIRTRRRRPPAAAGRRRQGLDQHRGRRAARAGRRARRRVRRAVRASWPSTPVAATTTTVPTRAATRCTPTAGARPTGTRRGRVGAPGRGARAPARSCSRRWTATAPGTASTCRSPAPSPTPSPSR